MREIEVWPGPLEGLAVELLAVPTPGRLDGLERTLDAWTGGALARCIEQGVYRGRPDEVGFFPTSAGRPHILLVGIGEAGSPGADEIRAAAGRAIRFCRTQRLRSLALTLEVPGGEVALVQAAAEGLVLGDFTYDGLREADEAERAPPPSPALVWSAEPLDGAEEALATGKAMAEAQNRARSLVSQPGNVITPTRLAEEAEGLSGLGVRVQAWGADRLRDEGFGALLAVAKGSREPPAFIIVEHSGDGGRPVVLVGKGITFDSGGISLKPSKGMEEMKYDMAGGAAVLGAVRALAELGTLQRVVGLVPAAENLPSGSAVKPGDVVRGVSGRSIEVVNTDAEGRLILSDALSYAARLEPTSIVDIATLTGGCVVALGKHASGLMSNDDDLAAEILDAARRSGEPVWQFPLWPAYRKQLDSEIADIKNSGGREGSPITAGSFLREFVGDVPWAHLDIAGTAWAEVERGEQPKGATGFGVRLLAEWVLQRR